MEKIDSRPAIEEHPDVSYEPRGVNARSLLIIGIGVIVCAVLVHFAVMFTFSYDSARDRQDGLQPSTVVRHDNVTKPTEPLLQIDPTEDLQEMRASEDSVLHSYAWVDRQAGIVRIPIEQAMKVLAEKGLEGGKR